MDQTKRVATITGAGGGIGSAIARRLAADNVDLCLVGRSDMEGLKAELLSHGVGVITVAADVSSADDAEKAVEATLAAFGRIDILVTSAGVTSSGAFQSIATEEFNRVVNINLKGVFLFNQAVLAPMKAQGYGRIINIGSVLAKNGGNPRPWIDPSEQERAANAVYGAAKAAVHAMTLYLAKEVADQGITANVVAPGPTASAMTAELPASVIAQIPLGRMAEADEIAAAVAFLASEAAGAITGEILDVNGGLWMD